MKRRIILAGATGLVGRSAARMLSEAGHDVHCIMRRADDSLPPLVRQIVAPTQEWADLVRGVRADVAISCLGTTMRDAGSKEAFAAVDLSLVLAFATVAKQAGAENFIAVSSVGASESSNNFYLATKGKAEAQVQALGFARCDFLRPGLLRGERSANRRYGEHIGLMLSPLTDMLLMGSFARYRSIPAETVARAIAALAAENGQGKFIHENSAIERLAS